MFGRRLFVVMKVLTVLQFIVCSRGSVCTCVTVQVDCVWLGRQHFDYGQFKSALEALRLPRQQFHHVSASVSEPAPGQGPRLGLRPAARGSEWSDTAGGGGSAAASANGTGAGAAGGQEQRRDGPARPTTDDPCEGGELKAAADC